MKIKDAQGRIDGGSGYTRVFGNNELGQLISKVQSTVISNGNELERIIVSMTNCIEDLEQFINDVTYGKQLDGVYLCKKTVIKRSKYAIDGIEPDLLIFVLEQKRVCKVIELKDGDNFDTKKSAGEKEHLQEFATQFGAQIPFVTEFFICSFNQQDKESIRNGFKGKFEIEHIMTGKELCDVLNISYENIIADRKKDEEENMEYFITELLKIEEVREKIVHKLDDLKDM